MANQRKVVIVGVGALGSHVVLLARNWSVQLRLVDFDKVEMKNRAAQMHGSMMVGRNKAHSLRDFMNVAFGWTVEAVPHRLEDTNVDMLLSDADLVIDCVDNAATRRLIQELVREHDIPCLHGAVSADGTFGRVIWDEVFVPDEEGVAGAATCEGGEALPFFALVGAWTALAAQQFLATGRRMSFQMTPSSFVRIA